MKKAICFLFSMWLISNQATAQERRINLVILVNDKLAFEELKNMYITTDSLEKERIYVNYVPGDLILTDSIYSLLTSDKIQHFKLHFSHFTYKGNKTESVPFYVGLSKQIFSLPYIVLNVYDFRDKKYKSWYQFHTKENFLVERIFPNSGLYIRKK
ncbi:hypothetical protein [Rufibacter latericius]|uniref:Uncharacterized protein n=1 Tax=Rufibacter latericius TaxID=2487040 RepID=A0A3M9MJD0_9BACT|nr:hypothetical protein [Rufibacter latericius]RNI24963.1 hypothetical protein EFB08_16090 [Rufibacter latericius]